MTIAIHPASAPPPANPIDPIHPPLRRTPPNDPIEIDHGYMTIMHYQDAARSMQDALAAAKARFRQSPSPMQIAELAGIDRNETCPIHCVYAHWLLADTNDSDANLTLAGKAAAMTDTERRRWLERAIALAESRADSVRQYIQRGHCPN